MCMSVVQSGFHNIKLSTNIFPMGTDLTIPRSDLGCSHQLILRLQIRFPNGFCWKLNATLIILLHKGSLILPLSHYEKSTSASVSEEERAGFRDRVVQSVLTYSTCLIGLSIQVLVLYAPHQS